MPLILLVKFDKYTGLEFPQCRLGIVPVFTTTCQFEYKGAVCSQTQFPLRLAYAITIYKS